MNKVINYKTILAVLLGNAFEFYCFILFIVLAPYIGKSLFSNLDERYAHIAAYGISFCGYISRPIGAIFLGSVSDIYSRKTALCVSVLVTGIVTFAIGIIPTAEHCGVFAIMSVIVLRFTQGLLVSGEEGGAAVYLSEIIDKNKKCLIGSLVLSSVFFGILIGRFACNIAEYCFDATSMLRYGWRVPFILALPIALIINSMRRNVPELEWQSRLHKNFRFDFTPMQYLFREHKKLVLQLILCCGAYSSITCMMMVYLPNTYKNYFSPIMFTGGIGFMMLLLPVFGYVSDLITPQKLLKFGLVFAIIFTIPSVYLLQRQELLFNILGLSTLYIITSAIAAPIFPYLLQMFPRDSRCTGVSFVFNTSVSIFSGSFPFICSIIKAYNPSILIPAYLIMGLSILSYIVMSLQISSNYTKQTKLVSPI